MIVVACTNCFNAVRIIGDFDEVNRLVGRDSDFWPDKFHCPRCSKFVQGVLETEVEILAMRTMRVVDLTPHEAFLAFNGMGMPEERNCSGEVIKELFQQPVKKISGKETTTHRYVLEYIEFMDGTKLYLGSAPGGAIVYKISPPPNHTKEALGG